MFTPRTHTSPLSTIFTEKSKNQCRWCTCTWLFVASGYYFLSKQISTNGLLTFNHGEKTFEPGLFPRGQNPSIAPFWADINLAQARLETDYGNEIYGGALYQQIEPEDDDYGSNDYVYSTEYVFTEAEDVIRSVFSPFKVISLTWMFIITFHRVPPFVSTRSTYSPISHNQWTQVGTGQTPVGASHLRAILIQRLS